MFNFDDRFIVLAILIPGVFLLGNIYLALYFLYPEDLNYNLTFGFMGSVYGLVLALILGALIWRVHTWGKVIDAFSTKDFLKKIKKHPRREELKRRYSEDFGKPFTISEEKKIKSQEKYLKGSVNNMFFTMHRAVGLEKPSAYRLMLDAYAHLFIATLLSLVVFIGGVIEYYCSNNCIPLQVGLLLGCLTFILIVLGFWVIPNLRKKFHSTVIAVYLDNQYRQKIKNFINGN